VLWLSGPGRGLLFDHQLRSLVVAGLVCLKFQKQIRIRRLGDSGLGVLAAFRRPQVYVEKPVRRLVVAAVIRRTRFVHCVTVIGLVAVQRFELTLRVHFKVICHASLVVVVIFVTITAVDHLLLLLLLLLLHLGR